MPDIKKEGASEPTSVGVGQKREAPSAGADDSGGNEPPAKRMGTTALPPRNHEVTVLLPIDAVGLVIGKVRGRGGGGTQ